MSLKYNMAQWWWFMMVVIVVVMMIVYVNTTYDAEELSCASQREYQLALWIEVFPQKLTVAQPVEEFPTICGIQRIISYCR
jgi:hypothetical protein